MSDLGSILVVDAEQAQKGESSGDDCSNAVSKGHEPESRVGEITASVGGARQGAFNQIIGGVAAGDHFAQMLAAVSLMAFLLIAIPVLPLLFPSILFHSLSPPAVAVGARLLPPPPFPEFRGTLRRCAPGCTSLKRVGSNRRSSCDS